MDPLTDVFTSLRVESALYGRMEATAPWGLRFEGLEQAKFGLVLRGSCWLTVEGESKPIPLTGGDCYLLPRGTTHALRDHPETPTQSFVELLQHRHGDALYFGGGGTPTSILGGKFSFGGPVGRPLTDLLPPVIHVKAHESGALALQTTLHLLVSEMATPGLGSQVVVSRLADTLFVQAIRAHLASCGCAKTGWLRGLADPAIGVVLRAMHQNVAGPWSVAALASEAGMSRSAFAQRFKELVGDTPLEYLTRWRMYQATRLLRESSHKLLEISKLVGYDSEAAFNKAFKRIVGVTPGEYRRNGSQHMDQRLAVRSSERVKAVAV